MSYNHTILVLNYPINPAQNTMTLNIDQCDTLFNRFISTFIWKNDPFLLAKHPRKLHLRGNQLCRDAKTASLRFVNRSPKRSLHQKAVSKKIL